MDNKKIPTCLGTAVLIVIAITAGAFVWIYKQKQEAIGTDVIIQTHIKKGQGTDVGKEVVVNIPQQFPEMSQTEKDRLIELTKDWQTYRNEEYGYEFKYPKGYSIEKNKYEADVPEISVVSDGDNCIFNNEGSKSLCTVIIRTISSTDSRIEDIENNKNESRYITRFSINGNNISQLISDGVAAIAYTKNNTYLMLATPYRKALDVFQGISFTFKEL